MSAPVEPIEPDAINFEPSTYDTVMAKVQHLLDSQASAKNKLNAFEFNGVVCSVCESDQNGWGALTVLIDAAIAAGQPFTGVNFKNENGNVVHIESREQWAAFTLQGAIKRQEFFS